MTTIETDFAIVEETLRSALSTRARPARATAWVASLASAGGPC